MSLINQMLTDLEARRGGNLRNVDHALDGLTSIPVSAGQTQRRSLLLVGVVLLMGIGVAATVWYLRFRPENPVPVLAQPTPRPQPTLRRRRPHPLSLSRSRSFWPMPQARRRRLRQYRHRRPPMPCPARRQCQQRQRPPASGHTKPLRRGRPAVAPMTGPIIQPRLQRRWLRSQDLSIAPRR